MTNLTLTVPLFDGSQLCASNDPEIWFTETKRGIEAAKSVCRQCPIRTPCGQYAIANGEYGVWGGLSDDDRAKLRGGTRRRW